MPCPDCPDFSHHPSHCQHTNSRRNAAQKPMATRTSRRHCPVPVTMLPVSTLSIHTACICLCGTCTPCFFVGVQICELFFSVATLRHRLFISAFMLSSKIICDDTYSNKSSCIVGQCKFALQEINQMEQEMCSYLEWQLNVDPSPLRDFRHRVQQAFAVSNLPEATQDHHGTLAAQAPPPHLPSHHQHAQFRRNAAQN